MSNQNDNTSYTAPQGAMQGSFQAPSNPNKKTKRTDIEPVPMGPQPGVIFAVVDLGTQSESFNGAPPVDKRKIFIGVEFPQFKQFFYEEDDEKRSSAIFKESTFFTGDKAILRQFITAHLGKAVSDEEAAKFNVGNLISSKILANVTHKISKKNGKTYENISSVMPLGNYALPMGFEPNNDKWLFYIDEQGQNFTSNEYAMLPGFLKKKIIGSKEAIRHAQNGGQFAQRPKNEDGQQSNPNDGVNQNQQRRQPMAPSANHNFGRRLEMIATDYSYESYKHNNWSDEQLVQHGKAKWIEVAPQAPAAPSGPPQQPQAPIQNQQQQQLQSQGPGSIAGDDDDLPF